eukprot:1495702-Amphidinium_carterae.1
MVALFLRVAVGVNLPNGWSGRLICTRGLVRTTELILHGWWGFQSLCVSCGFGVGCWNLCSYQDLVPRTLVQQFEGSDDTATMSLGAACSFPR